MYHLWMEDTSISDGWMVSPMDGWHHHWMDGITIKSEITVSTTFFGARLKWQPWAWRRSLELTGDSGDGPKCSPTSLPLQRDVVRGRFWDKAMQPCYIPTWFWDFWSDPHFGSEALNKIATRWICEHCVDGRMITCLAAFGSDSNFAQSLNAF